MKIVLIRQVESVKVPKRDSGGQILVGPVGDIQRELFYLSQTIDTLAKISVSKIYFVKKYSRGYCK